MKSAKLIGLALGATLALSTPAAFADDTTVGVAGPMTGQYASFGTQLKNGADAAVADINAAGGVMGKKLKLEIGDDACDPKQARAVAEKFASEKIPFVAGHYCSSSSIPASEAYPDGNVLEITPASTNPTFTDRNMWNTFRVCGRDDQQGTSPALTSPRTTRARTSPSSRQVDLRQRSGRRDEEGAQQGRRQGEDVRGLYAGRQGLQFARLEDEGEQDRCRLCRRLSHRGGLDPPPDAEPGLETR